MRNNRGLTLIELIVVLAVVAIIGAILIPTFLNTTEKARLKSDIQSARVLQNALELYQIEQAVPINVTVSDMDDIIDELSLKGYISAAQAVIQTTSASWVLNAAGQVCVDITGEANVSLREKVYPQLSAQEKLYVITS